ncbi:MAG TPA: AraC family transcriptional regulator [Kiritimatiellia bacterium]|nr:AraC family transcriptional regulator [Kiritimatiellia bacterium]HMO97609.1 AraC family transcriptional regulator [Kiritimatiellia bacterium]HMP95969.1 AraC family transcriptional regulator [Kiritimatiellia bacterium]
MQKRTSAAFPRSLHDESDHNLRPVVDNWDGPVYQLFMCGESRSVVEEKRRHDLFMDAIDAQGAFVMTLGGFAYYEVGDRKFTLDAGTVIALHRPAQGAFVRVPEGSPWHTIWVHVAGDLALAMFDYIRSQFGIIHRLPTRCAVIPKARKLIAMAESAKTFPVQEWSLCTFEFLNTWWQAAEKHTVSGKSVLLSKSYDSKLLSFHPGSIQELAEKMGYSQTYLSRKLKAQWNESPGKVLHRARLAEAAKLLRSTRKKVMHVAQQVGYQSPTAFIRAFKQVYGVSPLRYRHQAH